MPRRACAAEKPSSVYRPLPSGRYRNAAAKWKKSAPASIPCPLQLQDNPSRACAKLSRPGAEESEVTCEEHSRSRCSNICEVIRQFRLAIAFGECKALLHRNRELSPAPAQTSASARRRAGPASWKQSARVRGSPHRGDNRSAGQHRIVPCEAAPAPHGHPRRWLCRILMFSKENANCVKRSSSMSAIRMRFRPSMILPPSQHP